MTVFLRGRERALIGAGLALIFLVPGGATAAAQRYTPRFEYSPPPATPGGASATFAVVEATFPAVSALYQQFAQSLSRSLVKILTARGYSANGPFLTQADMSLADKKRSDLVLIPDVQIDWDVSRLAWQQGFGSGLLGVTGDWRGKGDIAISIHLNLTLVESLSLENLWTKPIDIPAIIIPVKTKHTWSATPVPPGRMLQVEDQIYNDVAHILEAEYKVILESAYRQLDPEELQGVKRAGTQARNSWEKGQEQPLAATPSGAATTPAGGDASDEKPLSIDDILKATDGAVEDAPGKPGKKGAVSSGQTPAGSKAFTNKDVVALLKAGLGDKIVINKIRSMPADNLDTSTDALIRLKKAGVSKDVIDAMLTRTEAQPAGKAP